MILERIREENKALKREGRLEGKRAGRIEGKRNGIRSVAKKMKQKNMDIVFIESVTGLSKEEIEKL